MQKKNLRRFLLEAVCIIAAVLIVYLFLKEHAPGILELLKSGNAGQIDTYLESHGKEGKIMLVLLQIVETISIVLPAVPVYLAAGVLFGKAGGVLVCYITNLILNAIIFLAAGKMHIGKGHILELEKQSHVSELFDAATHMDRVVIVMCLLPIVPNGMIPYLSAQTNVKLKDFVKAMAIGSFPAIAVYVCCGDTLVSDSYKIVIPIIAVLIILSVIAFIFRKCLVSTGKNLLMKFIGAKDTKEI